MRCSAQSRQIRRVWSRPPEAELSTSFSYGTLRMYCRSIAKARGVRRPRKSGEGSTKIWGGGGGPQQVQSQRALESQQEPKQGVQRNLREVGLDRSLGSRAVRWDGRECHREDGRRDPRLHAGHSAGASQRVHGRGRPTCACVRTGERGEEFHIFRVHARGAAGILVVLEAKAQRARLHHPIHPSIHILSIKATRAARRHQERPHSPNDPNDPTSRRLFCAHLFRQLPGDGAVALALKHLLIRPRRSALRRGNQRCQHHCQHHNATASRCHRHAA